MRFLRLYWVPVLLFILDVFILGQWGMALAIILVTLFWFIPSIIFGLITGNKERAGKYSLRTAAYTLAVIAVFSGTYLNARLAEHRSKIMISVLEDYKAKKGAYPDKLDQLVPEFLPRIPFAKINLAGQFYYFAYKGEHELMYMMVPPFGRAFYKLETKSWSYLD